MRRNSAFRSPIEPATAPTLVNDRLSSTPGLKLVFQLAEQTRRPPVKQSFRFPCETAGVEAVTYTKSHGKTHIPIRHTGEIRRIASTS
jgi:hypothetical protein